MKRTPVKIGDSYGRLIVLEEMGQNKHGKRLYLCECICGNKTTVVGSQLRSGKTKSCGCLQAESLLRHSAAIKAGDIFGRLTVLGEEGRGKKFERLYRCRCVCGNEIIASGGKLQSGNTRSCGCLRIEIATDTAKSRSTHGESHNNLTPEYLTWLSLRQRCYNPNNCGYSNYGERGITVDSKWKDSFESFLQDVGRRPSSEHSIDRINVNGNYEPGNVRWNKPQNHRTWRNVDNSGMGRENRSLQEHNFGKKNARLDRRRLCYSIPSCEGIGTICARHLTVTIWTHRRCPLGTTKEICFEAVVVWSFPFVCRCSSERSPCHSYVFGFV